MSASTASVQYVPVVHASTVSDYVSADKSGKAAIRKMVEESIKDAFARFDTQAMYDWNATKAALVTVSPAKSEIDYNEAIARRVANLRVAAEMLEKGLVSVSGIERDKWDSSAVRDILRNSDIRDLADNKTVSDIAGQKVTKSANRNKIDDVVERAFADKEDGTFMSVSQIAKAGSTSDYVPSTGAVAARLFPKDGDGNRTECTLEGVVAVAAGAMGNNPQGARKVG